MPQFAFVALDRVGSSRSGVLEETSVESTIASLRKRKWQVIEVRPAEEQNEQGLSLRNLRPRNWLPIRTLDLELSMRQMAVMLGSGLPLLDALRLLHEHADRRRMGQVWLEVSESILAGETMARAMERHKCFPPVMVQLTRVGEQTGELQNVQRRVAILLEYRRHLRNQIVSAMAYPLVVFLAAIFVAGFMVFNVIPKVQTFLGSLGRSLPPITKLLVDITNFANGHVLHGLATLVAIVVAAITLRSFPGGRRFSDQVLLRIPVIGGVLRTAGTAAVARNLQTLVQSGVSLLDSLRSVESVLTNKYLASELALARESVVGGSTLSSAIGGRGVFHPMLPRVIAIGESSGQLDEVLEEASNFFEDELSRIIRRLAALVEPAMLLCVGGIVGFVYIAFFMALFAAGR